MIDPKRIITGAGYVVTPELEAALVAEVEKIATNPSLVDKLFKKLCRPKAKRGGKSAQSAN